MDAPLKILYAAGLSPNDSSQYRLWALERLGHKVVSLNAYEYEARNALASDSLKVLQVTARDRRNVFEQLIEAVKYNSLGQISHALYDVGGEYRRNM